MTGLSKDTIEAQLTPADRRQVFQALGFDLEDRSPNADGWISGVLGPAELGEGENGSFSVNVTTGAVKDHGRTGYSGDLYGAVKDVLGHSFPEALRWVASECGLSTDSREKGSGEGKKWRKRPWKEGAIAAVYPYQDETGATLFEEVRFEVGPDHPAYPDKTFRFRQYAPGHEKADRNGYVWSRGGARPVLYRLPELQEAKREGRTIYVTEGPKDADTIADLGLPATCNPGGAGKWTDDYTETLRGTDVVIFVDNDPPGLRHGERVASAIYGTARSVKVVQLPGLPEGGDVTDWIEDGGTREELLQVVSEADVYEPPANRAEPSMLSGTTSLDLDDAPPIPPEVYADLPQLLTEVTAAFGPRHERDVALTGAVPVLASCLPNFKGYYGHNAEPITPDLYSIVLAAAAGGKGPIRWTERLGRAVDHHLRETSEAARADWQRRKKAAENEGEPFDEPEPPEQSLVLPANTSAAAFHDGLADRGGHAHVSETEIDTLVNAMGQEWGKFDDTLRKAYHHERVSYKRKTGQIYIEAPSVSLVLSGTPAQFRALIGSAENGLYSRMAIYYFEAPPVWLDQRPTEMARRKADRFDELASRVLELYLLLAGRDEPLWFTWENNHWSQHRDTFAPMLSKAYAMGVGHLDNVIKRAGLIAFRLSMTFGAVRAFEQGAKLGRARSITAHDADVNAALGLACLYCDHGLRFGLTLDSGGTSDVSSSRMSRLLPGLPAEFANQDVYELAATLDIDVSPRTLQRDLESARRRGLINRVKRSQWTKAYE